MEDCPKRAGARRCRRHAIQVERTDPVVNSQPDRQRGRRRQREIGAQEWIVVHDPRRGCAGQRLRWSWSEGPVHVPEIGTEKARVAGARKGTVHERPRGVSEPHSEPVRWSRALGASAEQSTIGRGLIDMDRQRRCRNAPQTDDGHHDDRQSTHRRRTENGKCRSLKCLRLFWRILWRSPDGVEIPRLPTGRVGSFPTPGMSPR